MDKEIAIVLVNWNQKELTVQCIDSLLSSNVEFFDIFLLDNGSSVDTSLFFKNYYCDAVKVFRSEVNLGFTGGNNYLLKFILADPYKYVLFLNNDTIVEPCFLLPLLACLRENDLVGAATGKILYMHDSNMIWGAGGEFNKWSGRIQNRGYNKVDHECYDVDVDVDYISGCLFLCRTNILNHIGAFEENLFAYFEDFDLSMRIKKSGFRLVYTHKSVIRHVVGASGKEIKNQKQRLSAFIWYLVSRNQLVILKKYLPFYTKIYILPLLLLKYMSFSVLFLLRGDLKKSFALFQGVRASFRRILCL